MGGGKSKIAAIIKDPDHKKKLQKAFEKYDKDKNDALDKEEMTYFALDFLALEYEQDKEKVLQTRDFLGRTCEFQYLSAFMGQPIEYKIQNITPLVDALFAVLDTNNDGQVSFGEFCDAQWDVIETKIQESVNPTTPRKMSSSSDANKPESNPTTTL